MGKLKLKPFENFEDWKGKEKMKHYNILVIGCGGGGSYVVEEICMKIKWGQISASLEIADDDMVEPKQIKFDHNFVMKDIGIYLFSYL